MKYVGWGIITAFFIMMIWHFGRWYEFKQMQPILAAQEINTLVWQMDESCFDQFNSQDEVRLIIRKK